MPGLPHRIRGTHRRPDGDQPPLCPRPYRVPAASDPYGSEPDPLPASATAWLDRWETASKQWSKFPRSAEGAGSREWLDGLWDHLDDLWPKKLSVPARPEMLPAPAAADVTSLPVPDGNPGSGPAGAEVTRATGVRDAGGTLHYVFNAAVPGSPDEWRCICLASFGADGAAAARHLQNRALVAAPSPHAPEASPVPERPAASAVAAEQGGGEGPAGQPPSCPAGLAAQQSGTRPLSAGELDPDAPWCPGCGFANYSAGPCEVCGHDDQDGNPLPVVAEVPVKPAEVPAVAAEQRAARDEP